MDVDAYLARLDLPVPAVADLAALRVLQERHLTRVPFENLSVHLGETIELTEAALFDKIVLRRRGGFCYELNGLFAALLRALGFEATLHAAQVYGPDGTPGPPLDHACVLVQLDGELWLADVGFGRFSKQPLRLSAVEPQPDGECEYLLLDAEHGDVDVLQDGQLLYRLERRPRRLSDFLPMAWWQSTSPDSHFTQNLTCSRLTAQGRVTLSGTRLIETVEGERHELDLPGEQAVRLAYRVYFGIRLIRLPVPPGEHPLTAPAPNPTMNPS
ncbi:N-hydroxyarylamine O-acetyltransferase [Amycolatopsis sulphurea]|uniref:N-hydroxyarylamine O-acetyltransferase n=1 Tax=Amycolatopsis sulphurea TaxID=76022 RepID=A0A2A9FF18_9PSEU|nr:arylamine N-acetyltransferase [Amycolatopsis sulphurea]PFG49025.1 N-hydroxyarylamine O-acetyltransferase [Amycolatopsis sulphurea]